MNRKLSILFSRQGPCVLARGGYVTRSLSSSHFRNRNLPSLSFATQTPAFNRVLGQPSQTRGFASMSFEEAVKKSTSMKDPDNSVKLKLYALYKQATVGKATGERPGAMDFVARAKFDAWSGLGEMSQDEAKKQYAEIVQSGL